MSNNNQTSTVSDENRVKSLESKITSINVTSSSLNENTDTIANIKQVEKTVNIVATVPTSYPTLEKSFEPTESFISPSSIDIDELSFKKLPYMSPVLHHNNTIAYSNSSSESPSNTYYLVFGIISIIIIVMFIRLRRIADERTRFAASLQSYNRLAQDDDDFNFDEVDGVTKPVNRHRFRL